MAGRWKYLTYASPGGARPVERWYLDLSVQSQAVLDQILRNFQDATIWHEPTFRRLRGDQYRGLGEIRLKAERKQHRLIGFQGPGDWEYTFVIGCVHKQQIYDPPDALGTAAKRRREIERGKATVDEFRR